MSDQPMTPIPIPPEAAAARADFRAMSIGPPACHYDPRLGERVTREHRDDCPKGHDCPGSHGCAPCTAHHCVVCGREHVTNAQPVTCPGCELLVGQDLKDVRGAYALLATQALAAGDNGQLVAAAPIPGGNAQVLIGPTVRLDMLRVGRGRRASTSVEEFHLAGDPLPPLAVLAQWEDIYGTWFGHTPTRPRATIGRAVGYLLEQLPRIAQLHDGPDWLEFTRQVRSLRAQCERALHDEREPELGVSCFECGDRLVRRFRRPSPCRHTTAARRDLERWLALGYPEALSVIDVRAARQPCGRCSQGGLDDPGAGLSWECPGCRKEYDPGEYATAVRRDLLDRQLDGDGWTHVTMAAEAASTLTGHHIAAATVRKWMDRDQVTSCCLWTVGRPSGQRLVFWPDVADRALDLVERRQPKAS